MRARRIYGVVKKLDLNQSQIAKSAGVNRTLMSLFLHGTQKLSEERVDAIEKAVRAAASKKLADILSVLTAAA